jgi:branched-subunit amino acid aminotransferase/4-amino-4-deoxychorismate lyase
MARTGYGLIETMRVREGRLPLFERHLARLARSLAALALPRPEDDVAALVASLAGRGDAVVRCEVREGRVAVTARPSPPALPLAVITASEPHVPYPHKTSERDCFDDAAREAEVAETDDALLLTHEGWVAEGTVWSLCWWEGDGAGDGVALRTPALDLGVLPGIGRARVLELVGGREVRVPRAGLAEKSLFLVNAVGGVAAIQSLDGVPVPADPRTAELAARFWPEAG